MQSTDAAHKKRELAKCMAMTQGSKEHYLGERMRHLETDVWHTSDAAQTA